MPKTLMILAGYRGAGKSSLLLWTHSRQIGLFGEKYKAEFLATCPSEQSEREMDTPFEEAIAQSNWLSWTHLNALERLNVKPDATLIHLDFLSLIFATNILKGLGDSIEKKINFLSTPEEVDRLMFYQVSWFARLMKEYDRSAVNTLVVPWDEINRRTVMRNYSPDTLVFHLLNGSEKVGRTIHQYIHKSWFRHLGKINCDKLITRVNGTDHKVSILN